MVISQTAKVGVAVVNCRMLQLHTKAKVYCRQLTEFDAMSTSVSRAQIAQIAQIALVRIGVAMRCAATQLMHGSRHTGADVHARRLFG